MLQSYYSKEGVVGKYEVFRSRGFSADWVIGAIPQKDVSMGDLPPFLRTLLVADGTVTKSLEAFYWEPIGVDTIWQKPMAAEQEIAWLDTKQGDEVVGRRVNLRGKETDTIYARAFSVIRPQEIPEELRDKLVAGTLGIGELIRNCGLETYRELLEIGYANSVDGEHIYRTYRIVLNHKPAILVTEHFPIDVFARSR
jgi:chorismate-pyruvate lyase